MMPIGARMTDAEGVRRCFGSPENFSPGIPRRVVKTTTILTEQVVKSESSHRVRTAVESLKTYYVWHMTTRKCREDM